MMSPRFRFLRNNQLGFSLVELLIAIAIAGVITGGITTAIMQILTINHRSTNHMVCVRQVQQAGKEVSKDALQAQNVTVVNSPFRLSLNWTSIDGTHNAVNYTITANRELERSHNIEGVRVVAKYISSNLTTCSWNNATRVLTFNVTASLGTQSETRVYRVEPRPGS